MQIYRHQGENRLRIIKNLNTHTHAQIMFYKEFGRIASAVSKSLQYTGRRVAILSRMTYIALPYDGVTLAGKTTDSNGSQRRSAYALKCFVIF